MKNTFLLAIGALLFSASVSAQSTVDSIAAKYKLLPMPEPLTIEKTFPILGSYTLNNAAATTTSTANAANATTANAAITATADSAAATTTAVATPDLTVTLDSASKGIVWIEGLPQGKIKAYLRKSPATYRILAQKTESGTQVPEGVAILDTATKTLNIALGAPYNEADPAAVFAFSGAAAPDATTGENKVEVKTKTKTSKTKSKVSFYTATKIQPATIVDDHEQHDQQVQQEDQQHHNQQVKEEKKEEEKH